MRGIYSTEGLNQQRQQNSCFKASYLLLPHGRNDTVGEGCVCFQAHSDVKGEATFNLHRLLVQYENKNCTSIEMQHNILYLSLL